MLRIGFRPIPGACILTRRLALDDGSSGFGAVWKAHNARLHHTVVFKFCKDHLDEISILTLHNELRLVGSLNHPGIIKLEAEYLDNAIPFLQYEFVDGFDLSRVMTKCFMKDRGRAPDAASCRSDHHEIG